MIFKFLDACLHRHDKNMQKNKLLIFLAIFFIITISGCGLNKEEKVAGEKIENKQEDVQMPLEMNPAPVVTNDHVQGDDQAPVDIIIYSGFDCLFCSGLASEQGSIAQAKKEFGEKIRIIFRHYFLPVHNYGLMSAEASECASEQNKFWQMHDQMFASASVGKLSPEQIKLNAQEIDLNEEQFNKCLEDEKYRKKVLADITKAEASGVRSVPTIFVNNKFIIGNVPYEDYDSVDGKQAGLKKIIERELEI